MNLSKEIRAAVTANSNQVVSVTAHNLFDWHKRVADLESHIEHLEKNAAEKARWQQLHDEVLEEMRMQLAAAARVASKDAKTCRASVQAECIERVKRVILARHAYLVNASKSGVDTSQMAYEDWRVYEYLCIEFGVQAQANLFISAPPTRISVACTDNTERWRHCEQMLVDIRALCLNHSAQVNADTVLAILDRGECA